MNQHVFPIGPPFMLAAAASALTLLVCGWWGYRFSAARHAAGGSRIVAIVEFSNVSQKVADEWLAPVFADLLSTYLSATGEIRVLTQQHLRDARHDIKSLPASGLGREALTQLRKRLSTDYVICGDYSINADGQDPSLSVDLQLYDTRSGAVLATISDHARRASLNELVERSADTLRKALGISRASASLQTLVANVQPPSTAVAERIGFALEAMARDDVARARDELLESVAEAPDYAPAYLYLSRAWSALGYRQKALSAAEQALARASTVPVELELQINATVQTESYEFAKAAQTWKSLVVLRPFALDYRLESIHADVAAGDLPSALASVAEARKLPQAAGDPRVELAAAQVFEARNDTTSAAEHAVEALRLAQEREASGVVADAQVELATARQHLGEYSVARTALDAAIAGYRDMGNPRGEVAARRLLASVLDSLLQHRESLEEYQRAAALAQSIGDAGDVAAVYRDICSILWLAGDRDGAQAAARKALQISRDTGDLRLQAWTLRALATIAADEAATDEVMADYREAAQLTARINDPGGHAWTLATAADTLRMRGELAAAQASCEQGRTEAVALSDPQYTIYAIFMCSLVAADRGDDASARRTLQKVLEMSVANANFTYAANAQLALGQLDFDAMHWTESRDELRLAAEGFAKTEAHTGEADAEALLALCEEALGNLSARDLAAARARSQRAAITSKQEVFYVDIALARLSRGAHDRSAAVERLRNLSTDAAVRHWINWALEAKLAEWQLLQSGQDALAASRARADLETAARVSGFGRILKIVNAQPQHIR